MGEHHWKTAITKVASNSLLVRGYALDELIGRASYGQLVYLLLKGELPDAGHGKMVDAILVSSVDHGPTPPSALAARTAASTGTPLGAAVAAGILSISSFHGGAIEGCMRMLIGCRESGGSLDEAAAKAVYDARQQKKRLPGFGHRLHTGDPRTKRLFQLAVDYGVNGDFVRLAEAISSELEKQSGKALPINVDGAIAALLCEMGFDPECANAFFMIARLPGLVAHVLEERSTQKPMRRIDPVDHEYIGPAARPVPEDISHI
jgi:citrate synthase